MKTVLNKNKSINIHTFSYSKITYRLFETKNGMWTAYERYVHGVRTFKTVETRNKVVRERQGDVENGGRTVIGR